jgi:hypothetical protein
VAKSPQESSAVWSLCSKYASLRLLKSAVQQNYCAYTALQTDPLLVKLRGSPEFDDLLAAAKGCQNRFQAQRNQPSQAHNAKPGISTSTLAILDPSH